MVYFARMPIAVATPAPTHQPLPSLASAFHTHTSAHDQHARNGGSIVITTAPMRTTGSAAASATTASPSRGDRNAPAARTYHAVSVAPWHTSAGKRTAAARLPVTCTLR